jgi:hypothetical protein
MQMALTGHLSDLSLSELIEFFCNQRKTGRLKVLYPQGPGQFFLQTGSVVDARIGVLRGIDAVYYALTLPNAKFEFSGSTEAAERTINQPWTQVVLEGLRRLDEGIEPLEAFPSTYVVPVDEKETLGSSDASIPESDERPAFLSFLHSDSVVRRKPYMLGAAALVVMAMIAVVGFPAGWYSRAKEPAPVTEQVSSTSATNPPEVSAPETAATAVENGDHSTDAAALAARRQRERERLRVREAAQSDSTAKNAPGNTPVTPSEAAKPGPKRVTVTVTYDESGRVVQASGADATAVRIARQKRFPAGKAGSATVTIPIN